MKQKSLGIIVIFLILSVLVLSGCQNKTITPTVNTSTQATENIVQDQELTCDELSQRLDTTKINVSECDKIQKSNYTLKNRVGGKLLSINSVYEKGYDQYGYTLTFQGKDAKKEIYIIAHNESDFNERNLKIGKFYEFDMSGICTFIFSMANSGALASDFTEKECK